MKTVGIIAEYNPFHFGHRYQLQCVRQKLHADYIVIAMSGDFVQRGEPALYDKYTRARMALLAGADLVLELPSCFAVSSAEDFASCGVALLDRLGVVDTLCFGSELGKLDALRQAADVLVQENAVFSGRMQELLRQGNSYPRARSMALSALFSACAANSASAGPADWESLLASPNNILGIEYLKAIQKRRSSMEPVTISRKGQAYQENTLPEASLYASASAIRAALSAGQFEQALSQMPFPEVTDQPVPALFPADFSALLNMKLLELRKSGADLTRFADVSPELADRIRGQVLDFASFPERIATLKTRQYTYTRISRALLHILLDVTDAQIALGRTLDYAPYARVLGFRKEAAPLLREIKLHGGIPLITKTADAQPLLSPEAFTLLEQDFFCSHLYQSIQQQKGGCRPLNEYTHSLVLL
ncbi:MAG: nucleotidyltransferase family protein [Lachnospiraceae bacterium]|nr:nucleotidyltransferase family protein [Lachnospiraceae bacterium]